MGDKMTSDVLERFLRYVQVDSQSDPAHEGVTPSTACQHDMATLLAGELKDLGCADATADGHAYVTATVPASVGAEALPALGLCAHIDTSFDAPAHAVSPHIVRYEGGSLVSGVVDGREVASTPETNPDLVQMVGCDIVCSDGTTLLSADDKAGVAEVMALVARLAADPTLPHPTLKIAFVPDEEIGHGASLLDLERFGAAWCYTVDGEELGEYNYECFSASQATVHAMGTMVHPGSAKDVMVNALTVLREFDEMLPAWERPEHTCGYEGYYHALSMSGSAAEATCTYIVRDFDAQAFAGREQTLRDVAAFLNARYGTSAHVDVDIREEYRNMAEKFDGLGFLIENAAEANRLAGIDAHAAAVRGGTDGAQLTFRGLPCPNLATGCHNAHSVREFVAVRDLEATVEVLTALVGLFAVPQE